MKKFLQVLLLAAVSQGFAQDQAAMEKAWAEYMAPGKIHALLASETGTWDEEMTMWMMPGAAPEKYTMTCEISMIMGGRYQQGIHRGTMMGMPFEGISTVGYNNASKKFESTWIDNMGTGFMFMRGNYDVKTHQITFNGDMMDPMTKTAKKFREVYTMIDNDTRKMEMYDTDASGKEYKSMEILMKRRK